MDQRIIIKDRVLSSTEKLVLILINQSKIFRLSNSELAEAIGGNQGQTANIISQLRTKGYLETISFDGRTRRLKLIESKFNL